MRKATVRWFDSATASGWQTAPQTALFECETTGYVAHKDKKAIVVCLNLSLSASQNPIGDAITIPMCVVRSVKYFK